MKVLADRLQDKYPSGDVHYYPFGQQEELIAALQHDLTKNDIIMLKGSHGMHLENVLAMLQTN